MSVLGLFIVLFGGGMAIEAATLGVGRFSVGLAIAVLGSAVIAYDCQRDRE